jgi:hypothetical protein
LKERRMGGAARSLYEPGNNRAVSDYPIVKLPAVAA